MDSITGIRMRNKIYRYWKGKILTSYYKKNIIYSTIKKLNLSTIYLEISLQITFYISIIYHNPHSKIVSFVFKVLVKPKDYQFKLFLPILL